MNSDKHNCQVFHFDLYGTREEKYDYLNTHSLSNVAWEELNPQEPQCFFVPKDYAIQEEYDKGFSPEELFRINAGGIVTSKDTVSIQNTEESAMALKKYMIALSIEDIRAKYNTGADSSDWSLIKAKQDVTDNQETLRIEKYLYRPFDTKYVIYTGRTNGIISRPRASLFQHMLKGTNISLVLSPQGQAIGGDSWNGVFVSDSLTDKNIYRRGGGIVFPLYLYTLDMGQEECVQNLNTQIVKSIEQSLGEPVEPLALFDYIYAVLHSPGYRERYKEFLKIDFPRIPYPTSIEEYHRLSALGTKLRKLHLMQDLPNQTGVSFPTSGTMQVDGYRWQENRVFINSEQYFEGVPASAWQFYIGGYQPAQKWLKDRKGMVLSFEDVKHYQRIIYVLQQTERIMNDIDCK